MRQLGSWVVALAAGTLFLVGAPAWAQSCKRGCEDDTKVCVAACKKHLPKLLAQCTKACTDEEKGCKEDCSGGGGKKRRPLPGEGKDEGHDDDHHH